MSQEYIKSIEDQISHDLTDLQKWNPKFCGSIDIFIDYLGRWFHEGVEFERTAIVRLFSSILRREDNEYYLVTPFEKWKIQVEDAPFFISSFEINGGHVEFLTSLGDRVRLTPENPIIFQSRRPAARKPYIHVRNNLTSVIGRNTYYALAEQASLRNEKYGIMSGGHFFPLE